jgi:hypothetical protein
MDSGRRGQLIERITELGLPSLDRPFPLVTLEEFFIGNDDYGSIGCNLTPMLGPGFFFEVLRRLRSIPNVQDVLVEIVEVTEDASAWPFSDRVYVFKDAAPDEVAQWAASLKPDAIEEGFSNGKHSCGAAAVG